MIELRQIIEKRRQAIDLTKKELASDADVDLSDLTKWLNGHKESMNSATVDRILEALGLAGFKWHK